MELFYNIYFTNNDKGMFCFERKTETFCYYGADIGARTNQVYISLILWKLETYDLIIKVMIHYFG